MQIFINSGVKQKTKDYWFGLVIPILFGFGVSLCSMGIFVLIIDPVAYDETTYIEVFFGAIYVLGILAIWPLLAWRMMVRANKLEKLSYKKGAWMSIKLYIIFVIYSIVSMGFSFLGGV